MTGAARQPGPEPEQDKPLVAVYGVLFRLMLPRLQARLAAAESAGDEVGAQRLRARLELLTKAAARFS
jgi:hypothetical protein